MLTVNDPQVMQLVNDYSRDICNGDVGFVAELDLQKVRMAPGAVLCQQGRPPCARAVLFLPTTFFFPLTPRLSPLPA